MILCSFYDQNLASLAVFNIISWRLFMVVYFFGPTCS